MSSKNIIPIHPKPSGDTANGDSIVKKDRRSKACAHCRKAKVKCIKDETDETCRRCKAQGIQCLYEYKIASYKYANGNSERQQRSGLDKSHESDSQGDLTTTPSDSNKIATINTENRKEPNGEWKLSVENRLYDFDNKLGVILELLEKQSRPSTPSLMHSENDQIYNSNKRFLEYNKESSSKRARLEDQSETPTPTSSPDRELSPNRHENVTLSSNLKLENILSLMEAKILFSYFDKNISPQLFGFDISHYSVEDIWNTCPFLIASICCIASIHHADFGRISQPLESLLYQLSKDILFSAPTNEVEAFNTIVGLCFCGFWFRKNQMFTGLALQLARTMNLISPTKKNSIISKTDRLKLWYLLYILDGQQSLAFNIQSLFNKDDEFVMKSRELLTPSTAKEDSGKDKIIEINRHVSESDANENDDTVDYASNYSNLRLVSQVEYHQAITNVLGGEAWDIIAPSSFGLPFKTNLELDKWMVQWTVLLSPFNDHPVWSSKSTLIYYNFAKMHINSSAVRKFHSDGLDLPKFDEIIDFNLEKTDKDIIGIDSFGDDDNSEDEDIDESEELALGKELSPYESGKVSSELALSAAETVLNIVLNDLDVMKVIKYVPIHIHIMLYYAALLVLKPPKYLSDSQDKSFENSLRSIQLVRRLVGAISGNLPTDKEFSGKIISALRGLIEDKVATIKKDISGSDEDSQKKINSLQTVLKEKHKPNGYGRRRTSKISAWPGYDAGHPSKK